VQLRTETPPRAAITIDGERFFEKAFSSGKAVAACFAFAMLTGWRDALDDPQRYRITALGRGGCVPAGTTEPG